MALTAYQGTMSVTASMDVPHSQNTAPVLEFRCLYTADIRRKQKRWQDGRLKFHTFNKRVMVYDEKSNFVGDTHWKGSLDFQEGEELELERGGILVEVGECIGKKDQDLTELVDKRVKEREERVAAKAANASPSASLLRNQGTPAGSALLRPKSLNAMLTPTGHHGRAVIPTTTPFEERHVASRDENGPPAKRRKQNDPTSSRNGYAQSLMGATLSLGSSKPSSTPTIRYEPFRARPVQQTRPDAIDLTMDDEEERRAAEARRKIAKERRAAIERPPPRHKRQKRSPPAKSGYASNLIGTPLMLSRSEVRAPVRTMTAKAPVQRQTCEDEDSASGSGYDQENHEPAPNRPSHVAKKPAVAQARHRQAEQSSSDEDDSSVGVESAPRRPSCIGKDNSKDSPRHQTTKHYSSGRDSSEDIEPPFKARSNLGRNIEITVEKSKRQTSSDSLRKKEGNLGGMKISKSEQPVAQNRHSAVDYSSTVEIGSSPERPAIIRKKQTEVATKKSSRVQKVKGNFQSPSASPPQTRKVVPALQLGESFNRSSALQKSSAAEPTPSRSTSSLRIKSRPRQKMMMLMSRRSSRPSTSNTSFEGSRPTTHPSPKPTVAADKVVLSQATIRLNAFSDNQNAELEARLNRIRSKQHVGDMSSSSDSDTGIDHETIDLLLTRKSVPGSRQGDQVLRAPLVSSTIDRPFHPPPLPSARKNLLVGPSSSLDIVQHSQTKGSQSYKKGASTKRKDQSQTSSQLLSSSEIPPDPNINNPKEGANYHESGTMVPGNSLKLHAEAAVPKIVQKNSTKLPAKTPGTATKSTTDSKGVAGGTTAPTKGPSETEKIEEGAAFGKLDEEPKIAVPEVLTSSRNTSTLNRRRSSSSGDQRPNENNSFNDDANNEACPVPSEPPGQLKEESPILPADVEVLQVIGDNIQSSTSRFRAMINPSSSTRSLPPRTASPTIESIETAESPCCNDPEGEPKASEAVKCSLRLPPHVEEALSKRPEPCSDLGFTTVTTSAALNTPDLASTNVSMGPPRARLANPATRGKSLQSLAANTVDTMNLLFNPMLPPAPRILSRVERSFERTNSDIDRAVEGPLKEAPTGGPWSREAFDLFGIHGPPRVETGSGIPAT